MGAKDSKPCFISYEDAVKRVSDSELRRIREAFKRCAGANGTALSLEAFVREVLSDGVPYEVADWLYQACGGTKRGIAFKELLCGIVVLTKGNIEEKIKFLWTLYVNNQGDNGTYIYKWDFASALHMENISLPFTEAHRSAEILTSLFGPNDKVTFEQFRSWLLIHKDATVLSKWLLSGKANAVQELDTPTFYQSLAGVTHLEERDIIELEKCFWSLRNSAPTGQLDIESLAPLLSHPLPKAAVAGVFLAFDENRDGHVDFKELCCGLSAACRGPRTERLKFCFKIFDLDRDGVLNKKELVDMADILCTVANEHLKNQSSRASTPSDDDVDKGFDPEVVLLNLRDKLVTNVPKNGKKPVFQLGPGDAVDASKQIQDKTEKKIDSMDLIAVDTALTQEDFLIWAVESADNLVAPFLQLLFEVCHIVLGLRPQCKHQERDIVLGWLRRSVQRGYSVGQFWYLVASEWWAAWAAWAAHAAGAGDAPCCRARPDDAVCDDSFTTTSTESMGSLLWRAETASLGSASSGVGSAGARPRPPGPIDNRGLLAPNTLKVRTLTGEGGHLRRDVTLAQHRDFELVPDALWRALALWYGGAEPLPRQVIRPPNSDVELELYPLNLKILRHVAVPQRMNSVSAVGGVSMYSSVPMAPPAPPAPPERQLAYTAAFSRLATVKQVSEFLCQALGLQREDVRLWSLGAHAVLLDDEGWTLAELRCDERTRLLLEVRNADLTWPEEIGALSMSGGNRAMERRETLIPPNLPGATGLHNLGNTCYMNAALQSVWNTGPLTRYFNSGMHLYEVNTTNPLGTKGALAVRYGELCKEVWSCSARSVAPLRVRWCVSRHARALAGGGQHDAQELLAWLLDALHEDLNRAAAKPLPIRDSDGRPDQEVAAEAWAAYAARNASIVTDLFYGQLKSRVRCDVCSAESTRFDAFNMLSLPLPVEQSLRAQVIVMLLDGSVPIKYGVLVNSEGTYLDLKKKLSELCGLAPESMIIVELNGATIGRVLDDNAKIFAATALELYAYETPRETGEEECGCDHQQVTHSPDDNAEIFAATALELYAYTLVTHSPDDNAEIFAATALELYAYETPRETGEEECGCDHQQGTLVTHSPNENAKIFAATALELYAYETPRETGEEECGCDHQQESPDRPGAARAEVSARAPNTSSLCMPALFCFKRSKSEIVMSQSPPNTFYKYTDNEDYRTLPKSDKNGNSSPTLSVKSLNLKASPRLGKVKFGSSPSNMNKMNEMQESPAPRRIQYLVAVHRKQTRLDAYFLPAQRSKPALFGVPLLVGVAHGMSGRSVYAQVWAQVARLLSARPRDASNHATDCDDSLGYEFPFTLRLVSGSGAWCALCPWPALCRGCALPSDDAPLCTYGELYYSSRCASWPAAARGARSARGPRCAAAALCPATTRLYVPTVSYTTVHVAPRGRQRRVVRALPVARAVPRLRSAQRRRAFMYLRFILQFTLRLVAGSGAWGALCPWPALCRGCALPSDDAPLCTYGNNACPQRCAQQPHIDADTPDSSSPIARAKLRQNTARAGEDQESCEGSLTRLDFSLLRQLRGRRGAQLAIDWDPTALHLRYQSTREKAWVIHPSVSESSALAARPVDLASCLRAFTSHERLEQRYHCARCRAAQPATKVLQIWRLPPILIIHLKRFQYVNNKWIKSQKVVNFPFQDFDPSPYLASVPQETIARHMEINNIYRRRSSMFVDVEDAISESESETESEVEEAEPATPTVKSKDPPKLRVKINKRRESCEVRRRERLESTSLLATPVTDDNLVDFHQHHLSESQDPFQLKYRLYAVVSHSGQMSGGHYVAYARNPSGTWLCYNDSMCRELGPRPPIDPASAYLLFYERQGLDYERYLPDIKGKEPIIKDSETLDPDENDLRKMCVIS
ncbi:ubiquitin carboxyl-terminal hydrolase 32 [Cydia pomonella]|uniref:ubiquitin carboxyl-terminal hydrolase 32 n=1 Tax=Cydia pomonella TaxID=82600 RepID=UPI002ADE6DD2|nr:ubiquitin carboxyl-terminal hydrolase 32 [Cydia pomonella]